MPSKYKLIEEQRGKPMDVILCELYNEHGNIYRVAEELEVTQPTISNWIMRCRLGFRTILAPVGKSGLIVLPGEAADEAATYPRDGVEGISRGESAPRGEIQVVVS